MSQFHSTSYSRLKYMQLSNRYIWPGGERMKANDGVQESLLFLCPFFFMGGGFDRNSRSSGALVLLNNRSGVEAWESSSAPLSKNLIYTSILLTSDSLVTPEGLGVMSTGCLHGGCWTTPSLRKSH